MQLIWYPHKIELTMLELNTPTTLNTEILEIELAEFQNSFVRRNFDNLVTEFEKQNCKHNSEENKIIERELRTLF